MDKGLQCVFCHLWPLVYMEAERDDWVTAIVMALMLEELIEMLIEHQNGVI